ncbi:hypothetical protein EDB19DRAFT_1835851 [Suillus lakei]|nr:hypothetical protein EDB19DRAFT_1835851 [Suillus lakei]
MFGSHILGGMKLLSEVEVNTHEDIERIIKEVIDENSLASQVRVLIGKTPLPGSHPIPLLVATSQGKETAEDNARTLLDCLSLCQRAGLAVISCGLDGASSEVGAHDIIHNSASEHLTFSIEKFGFIFSIPIFSTGPLVTVPDPSHVQKVLRNNEQSRTHLLSVGNHCLTHQTLVALRKEPNSGMSIQKPYHLAFAVHFVCGELFDAYFKCDLSHAERVRAAMRAKFFLQLWHNHIIDKSKHPVYGHFFPLRRSFISSQNFKSLNSCCDALIKLALVYREYYPTVPFLPWQHGSLPLEKIFGIAREFLTNFSYVKFLGILHHIEQRQEVLLRLAQSGVHERKEKSSGYVYDTMLERLSHEDLKKLTDIPSQLQMEDIANVAWEDVVAIFNDAGKQKARCEDESGSEDGEDDDDDLENTAPHHLAAAQAENSVQYAKVLHHMSRMSALTADLEDAEEVEEQISRKPHAIVPSIVNLLNPAPPSNQPSEHANVTPITTLNHALDVTAVVHLHKSHDRNSGILSEKLFERKAKYSHYEPKNLARVTMQLDSAAGLDMSDGNGVAHPNEIQHVLRHSIHTNDDLQLLMHKRQGGYSRVERWTATKANPTRDDGAGSSSVSIGNWAIAKQLIAAVPRLEDHLPGIVTRNVSDISPLVIGSYVVMQRSQGHYIGQVVCIYVQEER